jgi:hypothetical protein
MTATEWWCLAAAICAGAGAILHFVKHPTLEVVRFAHAITSVAIGLLAIALAVSIL